MCAVCGCSGTDTHDHEHEHEHEHEHVLADGRVIRHAHGHGVEGRHSHDDHGAASEAIIPARPPEERARLIAVERDLLERNNADARTNRAHFAAHRLVALNLVSSPGSGKTTLLAATVAALKNVAVAVIEGDQQTSLDAERIRAAGAAAVQINTGKGCHLDAQMVARGFERLHHLEDGFLFIENVGNLVCPASFDLGETYRVVIASVTEGEDKPLKYPDMFASADLMIVSKSDIAEACGADIDLLISNARKVKPDLPAIALSARSGAGMERWIAWLNGARAMRQAAP
jgi:hydrogenase nickel incorporation protein HypB